MIVSMSPFRRLLLFASVAAAIGGAALAAQAPPAQTRPKPAPQTPAQTPTKAPAKRALSQPAPLVNSPKQAWTEQMIEVPLVGHATAYVPKQPTTHVVLFLSGDGRWELGVVDMARRIAPKAVVIGIDYVALRRSHAGSSACWQPVSDLEQIARAAERAVNLPEYHPPILLGYSSGATLVYAALAGAPAALFAGGMSLGFCPDLPADHPVCETDGFKPTYEAKKSTAWLPKVADIKRDWYILLGVEDKVCVPADMHKFLDDMQHAHLIDIPHTGHGFSNQPRWAPPFDESIAKLLALDVKGDAPPLRPAYRPRLNRIPRYPPAISADTSASTRGSASPPG